jgi:hypothetical protein
MAHDHHHHGSSYYLDQLCTIAACGALGVIAVLMSSIRDGAGNLRLSYILAPQFFTPVLVGGIALLVLSAVRAVCLWQEAGRAAGHAHEHHHDHDHGHHHDHGHGHDHGHEHHHHLEHAHAHAHDHDHGWTPARYAVLMLPIVLFFLNLPNSGFSAERWDFQKQSLEGGGALQEIAQKGDKIIDLAFKELTSAALVPDTRAALEGQIGRLKGMYKSLGSDKEFTLFRVKMTCCAADAIPLGVRIISPENVTRIADKEWVEVRGQVQFRKLEGKDKYLPVLQLRSADDVRKIAPLPSEYEF